MYITVVICTRNRCEQLSRVLETFVSTNDIRSEWELIVVDNGSTDKTSEVIENFSNRLPIRRVWEFIAGLSNARNRAVSEARGTFICWTDDDVKVGINWLSSYEEAFNRNPEGVVFGGPIEPEFEGVPPAWLTENRAVMAHILAERELGSEEFKLSAETIPYGANFAVSARALAGFRFDPALGVGPGVNRLGEETAIIQALLEFGDGYWVPNARVQHLIPQARQTLAYVERYNIAAGETWAYQKFIADDGRKIFPSWAIKGAVRRSISLWIAKTSGKELSPRTVSELGYAKGVIGFYFKPTALPGKLSKV